MRQKGFAPLLILITLAIIIGAGVFTYMYFINGKNTATSPNQSPASSTPAAGANPLEVTSRTNPKNCVDTDYTGCDTSSDFITWHDDGERNPPQSTFKRTILVK